MTILNEPRKRKPTTASLVARGIGGELEETTIIEGGFATRMVLCRSGGNRPPHATTGTSTQPQPTPQPARPTIPPATLAEIWKG